MNEEPFGPFALVKRFQTFDDALEEANRLRYGLASYTYMRSVKNATAISRRRNCSPATTSR
jgi:succinate-semialdehyde dehydrogenase/glutarate-semialdehyde dehydrogenase